MILETVLPLVGSFRNKVVLVTGASSGIGRATAIAFAKKGAAVALAARRRDLLEETADAVLDAGGRALVVPTDVTDLAQAKECVASVRRKWNRIDVLVNSAGILDTAPIATMPGAMLESMFRVNVFGSLYMMQAALPVLRAQESGSIVNLASLAGRRGVSPLGGYCASKFAVIALTEALRTELPDSKIHVGLVLPGVVETPMADKVDASDAEYLWPRAMNMPVDWVAAGVLLTVRFRLREVSVPPGAATMEILSALSPQVGDILIRTMANAGRYFSDRGNRPSAKGRRPAGPPRRTPRSR